MIAMKHGDTVKTTFGNGSVVKVFPKKNLVAVHFFDGADAGKIVAIADSAVLEAKPGEVCKREVESHDYCAKCGGSGVVIQNTATGQTQSLCTTVEPKAKTERFTILSIDGQPTKSQQEDPKEIPTQIVESKDFSLDTPDQSGMLSVSPVSSNTPHEEKTMKVSMKSTSVAKSIGNVGKTDGFYVRGGARKGGHNYAGPFTAKASAVAFAVLVNRNPGKELESVVYKTKADIEADKANAYGAPTNAYIDFARWGEDGITQELIDLVKNESDVLVKDEADIAAITDKLIPAEVVADEMAELAAHEAAHHVATDDGMPVND